MKKTITIFTLVLTTILFTACKKETPANSNTIRKCLDKVIYLKTNNSCTGYAVVFDQYYIQPVPNYDSILVELEYTITRQQYDELNQRLLAGDSSGICLDVIVCNP